MTELVGSFACALAFCSCMYFWPHHTVNCENYTFSLLFSDWGDVKQDQRYQCSSLYTNSLLSEMVKLSLFICSATKFFCTTNRLVSPHCNWNRYFRKVPVLFVSSVIILIVKTSIRLVFKHCVSLRYVDVLFCALKND